MSELLSRDELAAIDRWGGDQSDRQTDDRIADLLDHIRALEDLIYQPGDPSRRQCRAAVRRLERRRDFLADAIATAEANGDTSPGVSWDRSELAALQTLIVKQTRLVSVDAVRAPRGVSV